MKLYGQLESAQLENLTADPTVAVGGRIYLNTTTGKAMLDDGTNKRALLRNDGKAVFGTDTTPANNIRLHHAGVGILQFVTGDDTTAENAVSNSLAQVGHRAVNYSTPPAVGQVGRIIYNTATSGVMVDNGTSYLQFATLTGTETLTNKTLTAPITDIVAHTDQTGTPTTPASGTTKIYTRSGTLYKLANDGVETIVGAGGNVASFVNKSAAYTASASDGISFNNAAGGAYTITLPAASSNGGVRLAFEKTDSTFNAVTIGAVTSLQTPNEQVTLLSNGSAWIVIDRFIPATWTTYTMNIAAQGTAPTKPTTRVIDVARWRRVGGEVEINYCLQVGNSAGAAAGSGVYYYPMPTGLTADSTVVFTGAASNSNFMPSSCVGWAKVNNGGDNLIGHVVMVNATQMAIQGKYNAGNSGSASSIQDVYQASGFFGLAITAPYITTFRATIPIAAWNT